MTIRKCSHPNGIKTSCLACFEIEKKHVDSKIKKYEAFEHLLDQDEIPISASVGEYDEVWEAYLNLPAIERSMVLWQKGRA